MTKRKQCLRKLGLGGVTIAALSMALAAGLDAQTNGTAGSGDHGAQAQIPAFDVASIKAHKDEGMMMRVGLRLTPDGISITGAPLSMLLDSAFGVADNCILDEPAWVKSDRYDIEAKVDPEDAPKLENLTRKERLAMLIPLFEDRAGLKFHHETKEMQVYDLVVAKGGPKLEPAKPDEAGAGTNGKPPMGAMMMRRSTQGMTMEGRGATMEQIAGFFSQQLGSTVVDKTHLTGKYDYTLEFASDIGGGMMGGRMMGAPPLPPPPPDGGAAPPPADRGPSIFTAVEEQLGLKLEEHKEPVDVIVIDHVEKPSPN